MTVMSVVLFHHIVLYCFSTTPYTITLYDATHHSKTPSSLNTTSCCTMLKSKIAHLAYIFSTELHHTTSHYTTSLHNMTSDHTT